MNKIGKKFLIYIVALIFIFYAFFVFVQQQQEINMVNKRTNEYNSLIQEQCELNDQLNEKLETVTQDEYIENIARSKLGMVKDREKIFVDTNK